MSNLTKEQLEKRLIESNKIITELCVRMQCVVIEKNNGNSENGISEWIEDYLHGCGLLPCLEKDATEFYESNVQS